MPNLNIVASTVAPITTAGTNLIPTVTARGIAGATITPGQAIFADPSAGNLLKPALASNQTQAQTLVGIALGSAALNQPVTYAVAGDITLPTSGAGSQLMSGSVYVLSTSTAGALISTADAMTAGNFVTVLGVGNGTVTATTTNTLRLNVIAAAAQK